MTTTPVVNNWTLNKTLGSGGFGIVELWSHENGNKLAIKKCKWDTAQLTERQIFRWINEVEIMKRLKHPNIVKGLELPFKYPDKKIDLPILCMEFCRKGDLRKVLNKPENCYGVSEKEAIIIMRDISSAVEYLHSKIISHRDLKPENIVLQDDCNKISYKLIDLGYAKELGEASSVASIVGTLNYVAPELLWNEKYSCSVDYWSMGILFYELITGTRPFLPRMQNTMTWMQNIKNKGYNDICAYASEGNNIIFSEDIVGPTNLSRCLKNKLIEWFRVMLQLDPKTRGKKCDKNGIMQLVAFKLLQSILSKQIIYVFSAATYKRHAYEVCDTTTVTELQIMIGQDTNIPLNQQILTNYFGKVLISDETSLLSQIQDPILFIFKRGSSFTEIIPVQDIPLPIQKTIQQSTVSLDFGTLMDYYRAAIYFIKEELDLFQLYIFALTIKIDLIITKLNTFNENIKNTLANVNILQTELYMVQIKRDKESINEKNTNHSEFNPEKITTLLKATEQVKLNFNVLVEDSNKLKSNAQSIDNVENMSQLYNDAMNVYELHKKEYLHKCAKPIEMVKIIFNLLKVREQLLYHENLHRIINK
ncbi:inhibitor of nuclear factor kappa B kinase subunit beta isoform X2 [Megalopta genalis]|uniref:inhibitor of nuclear factor kappa B kinase subunit beta isoform X2 n=1 Tax=Megalopta genalis TaxID=115081 RepID=UPI003FD3414A